MASIQDKADLALRYWHDASRFPWSYDETISRISAINPFFRNTFGKAIFDASLTNEQVRSAMQSLGAESEGKFPVRPVDLSPFYDALLGQVTGIQNWANIATAVTKETGAAVASGVGLALTSTALVAVGALLLFAYAKGRH